jgi:hypothetical protein
MDIFLHVDPASDSSISASQMAGLLDVAVCERELFF